MVVNSSMILFSLIRTSNLRHLYLKKLYTKAILYFCFFGISFVFTIFLLFATSASIPKHAVFIKYLLFIPTTSHSLYSSLNSFLTLL